MTQNPSLGKCEDDQKRDLAHVERLRQLEAARKIVTSLATIIESRWSTSQNRPPSAYYEALHWLDETEPPE